MSGHGSVGTVLVTGSAGRLGRAATAALSARGHRPVGFDRVRSPGLATGDSVEGDLSSADDLLRTVSQTRASVLIHLAATPDDRKFPRGPDDPDNFLDELVPNNIVGAYRVLEAARRAGVRRLILAGSGQVNWDRDFEGPWPVRPEDPVTPRYWYAATKVFLEAAGYAYARRHGLEVLAVRLGWCPRDAAQARQIAVSSRAQDVYLSPRDAGRFFVAAVEADLSAMPEGRRYAVVYAGSRPRGAERHDLSPARRLLGFEPLDTWPEGLEPGMLGTTADRP
jgi:nucleoside-diphosphate-sugar epimerase